MYHDWRGLISPESSGPIVEFQRTILKNKILINKTQNQLISQSKSQKALNSILQKNDTTSQRFQKAKVRSVLGTNSGSGAAVENTQSESLHRSDPEQVDQSATGLLPIFCHDCQMKLQREFNCVRCMARYRKIEGVSSANLPPLCINPSQDANIELKQKQVDNIRIHRKKSEQAGQSLCNSKKIEITSNKIPDQSEDISLANFQSCTKDSKHDIDKTLEFSADFQNHITPIFATTNKEEQHNEKKQENGELYTSSCHEKENTFQPIQDGESLEDYISKSSCDKDFLPLLTKTGHVSIKLGQGQEVHLALLEPIDFQECSSSTFDYGTTEVFHLSIIGQRIGLKPSAKVEAREVYELEKDIVKRPTILNREPSKTGRPINLHFQPKYRTAVAKATEHQKKMNGAVDIHDLGISYINKEYDTDVVSIQQEKKKKHLIEHEKLKRQNQSFTERIKTIYSRSNNAEMKARLKVLLINKFQREVERKAKVATYQRILQNFNATRTRRLEISKPHDEFIDASYPKRSGPSPYRQKKAAIFIQRFVRGWLVRSTYNRIKIKAITHGQSLSAVVEQYRQLIRCLRRRFDAHWEPISLVYSELEEWLNRKKKYEDIFAKREFWKEINKSELPNFFQDCGHYPSLREINETWALINIGSYHNFPETLSKKEVVELAFTIYPPLGAGLSDRSIYRSTWVRPVVNGEDGFKYICADFLTKTRKQKCKSRSCPPSRLLHRLSGHPVLQEAKIEVVGNLVAHSMFQRNQIQKVRRNKLADSLAGVKYPGEVTSGR
ncbi:uncharacterized protein [Narcine bancroftii]